MSFLQGKRWCFTIFVDDLEAANGYIGQARDFGSYGGCQVELCPTTGRYHLQGFCGFTSNKTLTAMKKIHATAHWELMRGTLEQNKAYCSKSETSCSDYFSWGEWPANQQGKRNDLESAVETLAAAAGDSAQRLREVALGHGAAFVKYAKGFEALAKYYEPEPEPMAEPLWRPWQLQLKYELEQPAHNRKIVWYYDPEGGAGKSTFVTWCVTNNRRALELDGKAADMANMVYQNDKVEIVFFDVTRTRADTMDYLYGFAEKLKDRRVINTKYSSKMIILPKTPHVVFFSNSRPDMTKWTADRYDIRDLSQPIAPIFQAVAMPLPAAAPAAPPADAAAAAGGAGAAANPGGEPIDLTMEGEGYYADLLEGF